jgi:hypothetical protein
MKQINKASNYWLKNDINNRFFDPLTGKVDTPAVDLLSLIKYKRAISNFVNITTGMNIPVNFSGRDSYTDGKTVNIAANIKDSNFDVAVGLALHEGSHIKLTDFTTIQIGLESAVVARLDKIAIAQISNAYAKQCIMSLLNVVEDRRIDQYIMANAPGYIGYYEALYDTYFNDKLIDLALRNNVWNTPTIENYMNHIVNFMNPNRNIKALPGLEQIWNIFNIKDIQRLKTTNDALNIAGQIFDVILANQVNPTDTDAEGNDSKDSKDSKGGKSGTGSGNGPKPTLKQRIANLISVLRDADLSIYTPEQIQRIDTYIDQLDKLSC